MKVMIFNVRSDVRSRLFICPVRPNTANSHDCSAVSQCTCLWYTTRWAVSLFPGPNHHLSCRTPPPSLSSVMVSRWQPRAVKGHSTHPSPSAHRKTILISLPSLWVGRLRFILLHAFHGFDARGRRSRLLWISRSVVMMLFLYLPSSLVSSFVFCLSNPSSSSLIHTISFLSLSLSFHLSEFWNGCLRVFVLPSNCGCHGNAEDILCCLATGKMKLKDELKRRK